jgi:hypothetical protein
MPKKTQRRVRPTPERAAEIYGRLHEHYPDAHCALDFKTPFQLLVATILSAQCTDKRVNMVTPALFKRYRTPAAMSEAKPEDLEEMIKSTGFLPEQDKEPARDVARRRRRARRKSAGFDGGAGPAPWRRTKDGERRARQRLRQERRRGGRHARRTRERADSA